MAVEFARWKGGLARRGEPVNPPVISIPVKPSPTGGSGTFLAADGEGGQWWVKPLNNKQGARVTVTEAVVGSVGALIGAPVCDSAIVFLPPDIEGWEFRPGAKIESGYAHAEECSERLRTLTHEDLLAVLCEIPESWPVSDSELERVGWFLESRAPGVAARLESTGGSL